MFDRFGVLAKLLISNTHEMINIINNNENISVDEIEDIRMFFIEKGISCSLYDGIIKIGNS